VQLVEQRALGQLPGERMLASASPDDQHLHGRAPYSRDPMFEEACDRS
jgi:hypothetical protein